MSRTELEKSKILDSIKNTKKDRSELVEMLQSIKNEDGSQYFSNDWIEYILKIKY